MATNEIMNQGSKAELPQMQPVETVRYWADAFAKDPYRLGGGMIVQLLKEYAALRETLVPTLEYTAPSQEECDRLQYAPGGWTRKFREAHKLGWDAAMKAKSHEI